MLTKTLSEAKKKQRNILIKAMNNDIGSIDSAKDSWNPAQISERAKDISYIRSLVDSWNPAQLNEALKMLDLPVIDTWNPAQIEEQRRNLVFYLAERTLTGNPVNLKILGNLTPEVTGLKVTMNPIQSGTGDPSPTNIRPITGRTEVSVTRTTGEDVETHTATFSDTIMGGSYDFVSGKVMLTKVTETFDGSEDETWSKAGTDGTNTRYTITLSNSYKNISTTSKSNYLNYSPGNVGLWGTYDVTGVYLMVKDAKNNFNDLSAFKTYLRTNNLQFCYELATPTTISTSAEEITLLKGTNVLSTDGDSIELKYKQNF